LRRFTRFLVSAAESDNSAIAYAARLAAASGATMTITNAMEQLPAAVEQLPQGWDVPQLVQAWNKDLVRRAAARARRSGVDAETLVLDGAPGDALVGEVERGGYDLLIVSAPRNGIVNSTLSTAARLVRECPSPVLFVRAVSRRRVPRVLVAVDAHVLRDQKVEALTTRLMESALWFAEQIGGEVHVLHAWQSLGDGPMRWGGVPPAAIARYHAAAGKEAYNELRRRGEGGLQGAAESDCAVSRSNRAVGDARQNGRSAKGHRSIREGEARRSAGDRDSRALRIRGRHHRQHRRGVTRQTAVLDAGDQAGGVKA